MTNKEEFEARLRQLELRENKPGFHTNAIALKARIAALKKAGLK